jgi:hypothetical protein
MAMQKNHDLANRLLIRPGGDDVVGALRPDTADLCRLQALGLLLDKIEPPLSEPGAIGLIVPDRDISRWPPVEVLRPIDNIPGARQGRS